MQTFGYLLKLIKIISLSRLLNAREDFKFLKLLILNNLETNVICKFCLPCKKTFVCLSDWCQFKFSLHARDRVGRFTINNIIANSEFFVRNFSDLDCPWGTIFILNWKSWTNLTFFTIIDVTNASKHIRAEFVKFQSSNLWPKLSNWLFYHTWLHLVTTCRYLWFLHQNSLI